MIYPSIFDLSRVPKRNFPSIEKLVTDVEIILRGDFHKKVKCQVLDGALWWMADYAGKGAACKFKSVAALAKLQRGETNGFVHDHIIPKKLLRERLLISGSEYSSAELLEILSLSVYCLIEKKEDEKLTENKRRQTMPNSNWMTSRALSADVWARYSDLGISIVSD